MNSDYQTGIFLTDGIRVGPKSGVVVEQIITTPGSSYKEVLTVSYPIRLNLIDTIGTTILEFKTLQEAVSFAEGRTNFLEKRVILQADVILVQPLVLKSSIIIDLNKHNMSVADNTVEYFDISQSPNLDQRYIFENARSIFVPLCAAINALGLARMIPEPEVVVPTDPGSISM